MHLELPLVSADTLIVDGGALEAVEIREMKTFLERQMLALGTHLDIFKLRICKDISKFPNYNTPVRNGIPFLTIPMSRRADAIAMMYLSHHHASCHIHGETTTEYLILGMDSFPGMQCAWDRLLSDELF